MMNILLTIVLEPILVNKKVVANEHTMDKSCLLLI